MEHSHTSHPLVTYLLTILVVGTIAQAVSSILMTMGKLVRFSLAGLVVVGALWGAYQATQLFPLPSRIATPGPLRLPFQPLAGNLTVDGVLSETNRHRATASLPSLTINAKLTQAAQAKLTDMFTHQYFEHVSPQGKGPADVVTTAGYAYLRVGENLALGNFANGTVLVQAWMDSPGHRANILSKYSTEIGIAVGEGTFEGKKTWLAVQEFGEPASTCPAPAPSLKTAIDKNKAALAALNQQLAAQRAAIEASHNQDQDQIDAYNKKVREFQSLQAQTNQLVTRFNQQVAAYNACLAK